MVSSYSSVFTCVKDILFISFYIKNSFVAGYFGFLYCCKFPSLSFANRIVIAPKGQIGRLTDLAIEWLNQKTQHYIP